MSSPEVSVIVPTLALPERRRLLGRALASIFGQGGVRCIVLLVVNGRQFDSEFVEELAREPRIRLIRQEAADLPAAYRLGRRHVATEWFTSLDDDDLLLPGALLVRVTALQQSAECDAVVTNGYCRGPSGDTPLVRDMAAVAADPLRALMDSNWLLPGAWLCRSDDASAALFDGMPRTLECTYLAVRLAMTRRVRFVDEPTVVWEMNTPGSASKLASHTLDHPAALRRILELEMPADVRRCFQARLAAAHHASSELLLRGGMTIPAWRQHWLSLRQRGGWRYLPFTRRLILSGVPDSGRSDG